MKCIPAYFIPSLSAFVWHDEQNYGANFAVKISSSRVWSIQTDSPLSYPKIPQLVMKMAAEQHCDPPFSSFGADCPLLYTAPLFFQTSVWDALLK